MHEKQEKMKICFSEENLVSNWKRNTDQPGWKSRFLKRNWCGARFDLKRKIVSRNFQILYCILANSIMPCEAIISGILIYPPHFFIGFLPKFHFQWYLFPPLLVFFFIFFFLFSTFLSILSKIYFFCVLPNLNCPYSII